MNIRTTAAAAALFVGLLAGSFAIDHAVSPGEPDVDTAALRVIDAARKEDLSEIALALRGYVGLHGSYPDTRDRVQPVCSQSGNAGCSLVEIAQDGLPRDPGGGDYWLRSNGQRFILYALRESEETLPCADVGDHGRPVREHFGNKSILCLLGP